MINRRTAICLYAIILFFATTVIFCSNVLAASLEQETIQVFDLSNEINYEQMRAILSISRDKRFIENKIEQIREGEKWSDPIPRYLKPIELGNPIEIGIETGLDAASGVVPISGSMNIAIQGLILGHNIEERGEAIIHSYIKRRRDNLTEEKVWNDFFETWQNHWRHTTLGFGSELVDEETIGRPLKENARDILNFIWESIQLAEQNQEWNNIRNWILSRIPPSNLQASVLQNPLRIKLTWHSSSKEQTDFLIERRTIEGLGKWHPVFRGNWQKIQESTNSQELVFFDSNIEPGQVFEYRVFSFSPDLPNQKLDVWIASAPSNAKQIAVLSRQSVIAQVIERIKESIIIGYQVAKRNINDFVQRINPFRGRVAEEIVEPVVGPIVGELMPEIEKEPLETQVSKPNEIIEQQRLSELQKTLDKARQRVDALRQEIERIQAEKISEPEKITEQDKQDKQDEQDKQDKRGKQDSKKCEISKIGHPTRNRIIFNEIAWMGTTNSSHDEWIELKNIFGNNVSLKDWQILDKDAQIKVVFGSSDILAQKFFLLERTNDDSAPGIGADFIYTGGLRNTNEALYLFDANCRLQDKTIANPEWPAGDNNSKRTMERRPDFTWQTSVNPGGTPKRQNSAGYIAATFVGGGGGSGGGGGGGGGGGREAAATTAAAPIALEQVKLGLKILISEVQITGGQGKAENDFIELYNPLDKDIYLGNYGGGYIKLVKRTKTGQSNTNIKSWQRDAASKIPRRGYYLWARSEDENYPFSINADTWTKQGISEDNGIALLWKRGDESFIIDAVGWGDFNNVLFEQSPFPQNPSKGQTISRAAEIDTNNNAKDFIKSKPTPKNSNFRNGFLLPEPWVGSAPAPNPKSNPEPVSKPSTEANHIVISEIFPGTSANRDDEFVELYNPTNLPVNLAGWELRRINSAGTESNLVDSGSFAGIIPAKGFFLIASENYSGSKVPDLRYSVKTGLLAHTNNSVVLYNGDHRNGSIIDQVSYQNIEDNKSLERKVFSGSACFIAQNENEFSGNGCDTNNDINDFTIRENPNPQNSQSFPEPRSKPSAPANFSVSFSKPSMKLSFSWNNSLDFRNSSSSINYLITDISHTSTTLSFLRTTGLSLAKSISEIGREYEFSLRAFDKDGFGSEPVSAEISIPSFLDKVYFFKHPFENKYLIDLRFSEYPFVPDLFNKNIFVWKGVEFYLNGKELIKVKYESCHGGASGFMEHLVLADNHDRCADVGRLYGLHGLDFSQIEDNRFFIEVEAENLTANDYLILKFYSIEGHSWGRGWQSMGFVAQDKTRYYFSEELPEYFPPKKPENLQIVFHQQEKEPYFLVTWDPTTDPDSLDNKISYHLRISQGQNTASTLRIGDLDIHGQGEINYVNVFNNKSYQVSRGLRAPHPDPRKTEQYLPKFFPISSGWYNFSLRAKDEFNLYSPESATSSFAFIPENLISQETSNNYLEVGQKIRQSFQIKHKSKLSSLTIQLKNVLRGDLERSGAKVSIFNNQEQEIFSAFSSSSEISNVFRPEILNTFYFVPFLELKPGKYFIVIEPHDFPAGQNWHLIISGESHGQIDSYPEGRFYVYHKDVNDVWNWNPNLEWDQDMYFIIKGAEL